MSAIYPTWSMMVGAGGGGGGCGPTIYPYPPNLGTTQPPQAIATLNISKIENGLLLHMNSRTIYCSDARDLADKIVAELVAAKLSE